MTYTEDNELAAESRELSVATDAQYRRLGAYLSLSASTTIGEVDGGRETTYRLYTMDLATHRLRPEWIGSSSDECDHLGCTAVLLNSFAAGHLVESGRAGEHSNILAKAMLDAQGFDVTQR